MGRGGQDRWPDTDRQVIPCHASDTQFKAWGSWGSRSLRPWLASEEDPAHCPTCDPDPDSDPCIPEPSSCLLPSPVQDCLVLPGSCWWDASTPAPNSRKLSISFVYFSLFFLLLILLVLLVLLEKLFYIQFVSLSLFSFFSLPLVGGWGLIENVCHSVYWHPALNCDCISSVTKRKGTD